MPKTPRKRQEGVSLHTEILLEIFSHLPLQSLQRLSCVLDDFSSAKGSLQTPAFINKHAFNMTKKPESKKLFIQCNEDEGVFSSINLFSLDARNPSIHSTSCARTDLNLVEVLFDDHLCDSSEFNFRGTKVIGSCCGLVCLLVECEYLSKSIIAKKYYCYCCASKLFYQLVLWNPGTGQHYIIPDPTNLWSDKTKWGFGYDSTSKSFKVIMAKGSLTELYDLSTNLWESITGIDWKAFKANLGRPVYQFGHHLNGALHWIVSAANILSLDLATKACKYFDVPHCCLDLNHSLELGVLEHCLVISCNQSCSKEVGIWVMKVYGRKESWTKVSTILKDQSLLEVKMKPPLWIFEDSTLLFDVGDRLAFWDSKLKEFRFSEKHESVEATKGLIHVDTFISPKPKNSNS